MRVAFIICVYLVQSWTDNLDLLDNNLEEKANFTLE